jgi:hypothetical protein
MKFIDFLNESITYDIYKEKLDESDIIDYYNKYCSKIDFHNPLFRGMTGNDDAYILNPHKGHRASAHTYNYYTIIFDKYLSEQKLPLRSKSIICTNDQYMANSYGKTYVILPYNNTLLGRANLEDIWEYRANINGTKLSVDYLNQIYKALKLPDTSYEAFYKGLSEAIKNINNYKKNSQIYKVLYPFTLSDNLDETLRKAYNIKKFTFGTTTTLDTRTILSEFWAYGTCLAIRKDVYDKLLNK